MNIYIYIYNYPRNPYRALQYKRLPAGNLTVCKVEIHHVK